MQIDQKKWLEIQAATSVAAFDTVKAQIAAGKPAKGMSKARHAAVVADTLAEILGSYGDESGDPASKYNREVLRAACSGNLLNASALRQDLEKAGVLVKSVAISTEYGVE